MKLILKNVTKNFPGRKVFSNISIEINESEILVVTGANGSGKTTLLKIISSMFPASSGEIIFQNNGRDYSGAGILQFIGYVAPDLYLYDELSAIENLEFFARVSGIEQLDFEAELEKFGLKGRGNDDVRSFSSGMKQRLKYILALMRTPQLLLLDEPSANLDDKGKMLVDNIIKSHKGITVIATNEQTEKKYATKEICLD